MKLLQFNLLPDDVKRVGEYAVWRRIAIRFGFAGLSVILFSTAVLLPSYFDVTLQEREVMRLREVQEQNPLRPKAEAAAKNVAAANAEIRALKAALSSEESVSQIMIAVLSQTPAGIRLKHVEFQRESRRFSLSGTAATRADVLEFEKRLRALSLAQDVVSPLSNIIKETNIEFTIQVVVKK